MLLDLSADAGASAEQGGTALHRAAKKGHKGIVEILVLRTPIDSHDQTGATPLHRAARHGHVEIARLLLELGADINSCQTHMKRVEESISYWGSEHYSHSFDQDAMIKLQKVLGGSPLHEAAANGHVLVAKTLVEAHAQLATEDTYGGHALHRAAAEGHLAIVELLLRAGADLNHNATCTIHGNPHKDLVKSHVYYIMDKFWGTPLHLAAKHGHIPVVEKLISEGAALEIRDSQHQTPLSAAASAGQGSVVEFLLRHGCRVDGSVTSASIADTVDTISWRPEDRTDHKFNGYTASSKRQALRKVEWEGELLAIATIKGVEGLTPLHDAAWYGHLEVVKLLVEHGASINQRDALGRTPLLLATKMAAYGVVMLLTQHGANASLADSQGDSPLKVACQLGQSDLINLLVDSVVDIVAEEISCDLMLTAAKAENWSTMQLLFEHGAQPILFRQIPDREMPERYYGWGTVTEKRWPLLWYTCQSGGESFFTKFFAQAPPQSIKLADINALLHRAMSCRSRSLLEFLLNHGGEINNCNDHGQSLLMLAINHYDLVLCKVLISRGIDLNIRSSDLKTSKVSCALSEACQWTYEARFVSLLLDAGADPNNCQPLNRISYPVWEKGARRMTRLLLGYGADPNAQDSKGNTGLLCVAEYSNVEAVELMLKHGGDPEIRNNKGETPISRAIDAIIRHRLGNEAQNQDRDKIVISLLKHSITPKAFEDRHHLLKKVFKIALVKAKHSITPKAFEDRHHLLKKVFKIALVKANAKRYDQQPIEHLITPQRLRHWASLGEEPLYNAEE
jgi:ankyrin repeat protein